MLCWCPQADCVGVNVNCHELTANWGELVFFNLRIIYGDSRSNNNQWGPLGGLGCCQELP